MRALIEAHFPITASSARSSAGRAEAEFVWVLDPIGGTKSFISGVPLFGVDRADPPAPDPGVNDQPIRRRWVGAGAGDD
jgi:fructose-1,6-bisphosphatase/inositol monophosphatase family enzyme